MNFTDNKKRNRVLVVLFAGVMMGALDIAIVGPALPAIQAQFGISERAVAWIFAIYVLFNLVGTPFMAKLSDLMNRRAIYILDVTMFAIGSLIVALSPSFTVLLIGRGIQGFGSGGIFPVASAVIGDTFPENKRGSALGLIGAVFGIAFLIGPLLAGIILMFSWHWLFLVNIPVAAIVIGMSIKLLPANKVENKNPFDWNGMILVGILLASMAYGFNNINSSNFFHSFISLNVLPFILLAIILLLFFIKNENKAKDPILRIGLLTSRQVIIISIIAIGAGISEAAVVFVPPLLVSTFSITTSAASFMLIPVVIAMAFGSPLAGKMLDKLGSKVVLIFGSILLALGMLGLGTESMNVTFFYISAFILGIGMGFIVGPPLRYIMLNESTKTERTSAQGAIRLFTGIGQLFGGALVGAIAASQGGGASGFRYAYLMIGIMAIVLVFLSFGLKNRSDELATALKNS